MACLTPRGTLAAIHTVQEWTGLFLHGENVFRREPVLHKFSGKSCLKICLNCVLVNAQVKTVDFTLSSRGGKQICDSFP